MAEYYHYTSDAYSVGIIRDGMYRNSHAYTNNQYFDQNEAGQAVGIMPYRVECVLLFQDDGQFRSFRPPLVSRTNVFLGGATQFEHPQRPKPIAKRKIRDQHWQKL